MFISLFNRLSYNSVIRNGHIYFGINIKLLWYWIIFELFRRSSKSQVFKKKITVFSNVKRLYDIIEGMLF